MANQQDREAQQELEKLFNFLKWYNLHDYYNKFLQNGVCRLNHLKAVAGDDASLDEIGLSRIERVRLKKKVKENVSWKGKFMVTYCILWLHNVPNFEAHSKKNKKQFTS